MFKEKILFFSSFRRKKIISIILAFLVFCSACSPAWAREGNPGNKGNTTMFLLGFFAGAVTDIAIIINPYAGLAGSVASNITGLCLYYFNYSSYGEPMFEIGGITITKGQFYSMVAGAVAGAIAGYASGLAGAGSGAAQGAASGAVSGAGQGLISGFFRAFVELIKSLFYAIRDMFKNIVQAIMKGSIVDLIKAIVKFIVDIFKAIYNFFKTLFGKGPKEAVKEPAKKTAEQAGQSLAKTGANVGQEAGKGAANVAGKTAKGAADVAGKAAKGSTNILSKTKEVVTHPIKSFEKFARNAPNRIIANPYYHYGANGEIGQALLHLAGDVAVGTGKLIVSEAVKQKLEEAGWDETLASIAGTTVSLYAGAFLTPMVRRAFGSLFGLYNLSNTGGYLSKDEAAAIRAVEQMGNENINIYGYTAKGDLEFISGKTRDVYRLPVQVETTNGTVNTTLGAALANYPAGSTVTYMSAKGPVQLNTEMLVGYTGFVNSYGSMYANNLPLMQSTGGTWFGFNGEPITGHNYLSSGLIAMRQVGLGPLIAGSAKLAILLSLGYRTDSTGDVTLVFDNVWQMALAEAAGGVASTAVTNISALDKYFVGAGSRRIVRGDTANGLSYERKDGLSWSEFLARVIVAEAGEAGMKIAWGYLLKETKTEANLVTEMQYLMVSSVLAGTIDGLFNRNPKGTEKLGISRWASSVAQSYRNKLIQALLYSSMLPYSLNYSGFEPGAFMAEWQVKDKFTRHVDAMSKGVSTFQATGNRLMGNLENIGSTTFGEAISSALTNPLISDPEKRFYARFETMSEDLAPRIALEKQAKAKIEGDIKRYQNALGAIDKEMQQHIESESALGKEGDEQRDEKLNAYIQGKESVKLGIQRKIAMLQQQQQALKSDISHLETLPWMSRIPLAGSLFQVGYLAGSAYLNKGYPNIPDLLPGGITHYQPRDLAKTKQANAANEKTPGTAIPRVPVPQPQKSDKQPEPDKVVPALFKTSVGMSLKPPPSAPKKWSDIRVSFGTPDASAPAFEGEYKMDTNLNLKLKTDLKLETTPVPPAPAQPAPAAQPVPPAPSAPVEPEKPTNTPRSQPPEDNGTPTMFAGDAAAESFARDIGQRVADTTNLFVQGAAPAVTTPAAGEFQPVQPVAATPLLYTPIVDTDYTDTAATVESVNINEPRVTMPEAVNIEGAASLAADTARATVNTAETAQYTPAMISGEAVVEPANQVDLSGDAAAESFARGIGQAVAATTTPTYKPENAVAIEGVSTDLASGPSLATTSGETVRDNEDYIPAAQSIVDTIKSTVVRDAVSNAS